MLIAIEGIDQSGKATLGTALERRMEAGGSMCTSWHSPTTARQSAS